MPSAFYGLEYDELQALRTVYLAAINALATAQSYDLSVLAKDGVSSNRSVTRADLAEIKRTLAEVMAELRRLGDQSVGRVAYADFSSFNL